MDDPSGNQRIRALEGRIVDLEVRLAFQQQTIEDLDSVVREFASRVERLERELRDLRGHSTGAQPIAEPSDDDFSPL